MNLHEQQLCVRQFHPEKYRHGAALQMACLLGYPHHSIRVGGGAHNEAHGCHDLQVVDGNVGFIYQTCWNCFWTEMYQRSEGWGQVEMKLILDLLSVIPHMWLSWKRQKVQSSPGLSPHEEQSNVACLFIIGDSG